MTSFNPRLRRSAGRRQPLRHSKGTCSTGPTSISPLPCSPHRALILLCLGSFWKILLGLPPVPKCHAAGRRARAAPPPLCAAERPLPTQISDRCPCCENRRARAACGRRHAASRSTAGARRAASGSTLKADARGPARLRHRRAGSPRRNHQQLTYGP